MSRVFLLLAFLSAPGCTGNEYRFERIDGEQAVVLPLKFDGFYGVRDGALVKAEGRFADRADIVTMNIDVYLRPPAEFQSGRFEATIGGKMSSGAVECPSFTFQGGQTALPALGGVFILKDDQNRPLYRIRIPATTLSGRRSASSAGFRQGRFPAIESFLSIRFAGRNANRETRVHDRCGKRGGRISCMREPAFFIPRRIQELVRCRGLGHPE
jgi:hypothetical protein